MRMKKNWSLRVFLILLSFVVLSCRNRKVDSLQTVPVLDNLGSIKDTLVSLSFLGITLADRIDVNDSDLVLVSETTNTDEVARLYKAEKMIVFNGSAVPIEIKYYTINNIVCKIEGTIETDEVTKDLISTYYAKYSNPTEEYADYMEWAFKNQSITYQRTIVKEWNMAARPMREENHFKEIRLSYEDYDLSNKYDATLEIQWDYDRAMRPIRDSIKAVQEKAIKDSLKEIEKAKRMKDAFQI